MKNVKIVRVAEWDGWCGACAAARPLVLTRTGRQRVRTWLAGAADDSRPLTLTCRLCGTGVGVPLEQDDPPVVVAVERFPRPVAAVTAEAAPTDAGEASQVAEAVPTMAGEALQAASPPDVPAQATPSAAELAAGRQAVARALSALLAQRSAAGTLAQPAPVPVVAPAVVPFVPLQRTASRGGLAELQLLADGIDLLSSGRA